MSASINLDGALHGQAVAQGTTLSTAIRLAGSATAKVTANPYLTTRGQGEHNPPLYALMVRERMYTKTKGL